MGVVGQRFTLRKENQHSIYRSLGGPQGKSRRVWKILPSPGFQRRTIQAVAIRYTDYIIWLASNKILHYLDGCDNIISNEQGVECKALPKDQTWETALKKYTINCPPPLLPAAMGNSNICCVIQRKFATLLHFCWVTVVG